MRYTYFYQHELNEIDNHYDILLSGYDGCERTTHIFELINAKVKYWLIFPQYNCKELPNNGINLISDKMDESGYILDIFSQIDNNHLDKSKICIDCTGILIPHLMFLLMHLQSKNIRKFDVVYTAPSYYQKEENTIFSEIISAPRSIAGYEMNCKVNEPEYLIMFAGFNNDLIKSVALSKENSEEKHIIIGFPPLEADMYQQNLLQLHKSKEIIGEKGITYYKISSFDPFVAAERLEKIVKQIEEMHRGNIGAINISPLATKISAVATALVFMYNTTSSLRVIYPPMQRYYIKQAVGIGNTRVFSVELPEYYL